MATESNTARLVVQPASQKEVSPIYFHVCRILPFWVLYLIILPVQQIFIVSPSCCQASLQWNLNLIP